MPSNSTKCKITYIHSSVILCFFNLTFTVVNTVQVGQQNIHRTQVLYTEFNELHTAKWSFRQMKMNFQILDIQSSHSLIYPCRPAAWRCGQVPGAQDSPRLTLVILVSLTTWNQLEEIGGMSTLWMCKVVPQPRANFSHVS